MGHETHTPVSSSVNDLLDDDVPVCIQIVNRKNIKISRSSRTNIMKDNLDKGEELRNGRTSVAPCIDPSPGRLSRGVVLSRDCRQYIQFLAMAVWTYFPHASGQMRLPTTTIRKLYKKSSFIHINDALPWDVGNPERAR